MSKARSFELGDVCIHDGFICRVDAVERNFARGLYGVKDGTELNPWLTLTPLYGPDNKPISEREPHKASSGAVERLAEEVVRITNEQIANQKRLEILAGLVR